MDTYVVNVSARHTEAVAVAVDQIPDRFGVRMVGRKLVWPRVSCPERVESLRRQADEEGTGSEAKYLRSLAARIANPEKRRAKDPSKKRTIIIY